MRVKIVKSTEEIKQNKQIERNRFCVSTESSESDESTESIGSDESIALNNTFKEIMSKALEDEKNKVELKSMLISHIPNAKTMKINSVSVIIKEINVKINESASSFSYEHYSVDADLINTIAQCFEIKGYDTYIKTYGIIIKWIKSSSENRDGTSNQILTDIPFACKIYNAEDMRYKGCKELVSTLSESILRASNKGRFVHTMKINEYIKPIYELIGKRYRKKGYEYIITEEDDMYKLFIKW